MTGRIGRPRILDLDHRIDIHAAGETSRGRCGCVPKQDIAGRRKADILWNARVHDTVVNLVDVQSDYIGCHKKVVFSKVTLDFTEKQFRRCSVYLADISAISFFMKPLLLRINTWLYGKIKIYAQERGIPVVGAIRLILTEFFRNKPGL